MCCSHGPVTYAEMRSERLLRERAEKRVREEEASKRRAEFKVIEHPAMKAEKERV
jgi:hypothetical protein